MNTRPTMERIKLTAKHDSSIVMFKEVQRYHEDAEELWKERKVILADPITGELNTVCIDDIDYEEYPYSWGETDPETHMCIETEYDRYINDVYKEHMRVSEEAGEGIHKGKMFSVGVADGCAFYVITKVNKKSVRIEWRGFHPDNWVDQTLGYGGSFPTHCIENHVKYADGMKKLFGKKQAA